MTTALWCVLAAGMLPWIATIVTKAGGSRYDNRDPRAWLERQQGWRKRADNAQKNAFEAFPLFAAAVLTAQMLHAPQTRIDLLALVFVAARVAYLVCYLGNWHALRSLVWTVAWLCPILIFVAAA